MRIETLHIGMTVRHPAYGMGVIKGLAERTADIRFEDGATRTVAPGDSGLQPTEPTASITGLELPLKQFVQETVAKAVLELGLEKPDMIVDELAGRWHHGTMLLQPADKDLQAKEVPLETFFHKIVMMRNNLRVLEQKLNGHDKLTEAEKVEMQQYITRCYGSMTTFNLLFVDKGGQFGK